MATTAPEPPRFDEVVSAELASGEMIDLVIHRNVDGKVMWAHQPLGAETDEHIECRLCNEGARVWVT